MLLRWAKIASRRNPYALQAVRFHSSASSSVQQEEAQSTHNLETQACSLCFSLLYSCALLFSILFLVLFPSYNFILQISFFITIVFLFIGNTRHLLLFLFTYLLFSHVFLRTSAILRCLEKSFHFEKLEHFTLFFIFWKDIMISFFFS